MTDSPDKPDDNQPAKLVPKRRTGKVKAVQVEIIERRLAGEYIRDIQADLERREHKVTADTIIDIYDEHIALSRQARPKSPEELTEEAIQRAEWAVAETRAAWTLSRRMVVPGKDGAPDQVFETRGEPRLMAEYRQACAQLAKLQGLDRPVEVKHSGAIEFASSPLDELTAALDRLAPKDSDGPTGA